MKSSPFSSLITKMNGGNYEMWAMQVKRTLIAHDKEHLILEPEPVQKVGKYTTWFKDNSLVMVWIVGTLSQDIVNEVLHKESEKDMWDSLAATYSQARNETRIMQLYHDIHQMRQDGRPLHTYYSSLKSMFERLNSYFPACKCEQQKAYRDMLMVGVFLSGLDSVYESAKNQMLTSPSIPPIDEAYSRLSRIPIPALTVPDTTSAMLATRGRGGSFFARGRGGRGRGNTTSRPVCQFCHRIGHTVDKCWQKHGRPAFANQTASTDSPEQPKAQHTASSSELRVDDIISQLRNLIGDRPQHAPDPTTCTITTAATASSSGMYSAYTVCPSTDTTNWLIDSGASTHLCGDKTQFTSYVPAPPGRSVILADGKYSPVVGHGKVQLTSLLPLQHVLHAPEFPHSLLSISQITRDLNCRAIFDSSSLVFQDILTGRVIGSGREQGGEYHEHAHAPNDLDMPIAQRKGKRSCTLHPISGHLSMDRLTPTYRQFVKGLSTVVLPQTPMDALSDPKLLQWTAQSSNSKKKEISAREAIVRHCRVGEKGELGEGGEGSKHDLWAGGASVTCGQDDGGEGEKGRGLGRTTEEKERKGKGRTAKGSGRCGQAGRAASARLAASTVESKERPREVSDELGVDAVGGVGRASMAKCGQQAA
ncbi:hypothetical protein EJ110_NYTH28026 [Nymphaea thermarum]|nr:hypothetical protein EJ110_NYTH28026 [Nymphaea thermarum]